MDEKRKAILDALKKHGICTYAQLMDETKLRYVDVKEHVHKMADEGIVTIQRGKMAIKNESPQKGNAFTRWLRDCFGVK